MGFAAQYLKGGVVIALKKLELQLPEELLATLGTSSQEVSTKVLERVILSLVHEGEISIRYGAELLGLGYHDMLDLMGKHKVPVVNYSPEEFRKEVASLDKLLG